MCERSRAAICKATGYLVISSLVLSVATYETSAQIISANDDVIISQSPLSFNPAQGLEGALSGAIERYVENSLTGLPVPFSNNWGNRIRVQTGVETYTERVCRGSGIFRTCYNEPRTRRKYSQKNHGLWSRGTASLSDDLNIRIYNVRRNGTRITFNTIVSGLVRTNPEFRAYNHGVGLGTARVSARARMKAYMNTTIDISFRDGKIHWNVSTTSNDIRLEDFYLERVGRIGGYSAELLGDLAKGGIRNWIRKNKPELQKTISGQINVATARDRAVTDIIVRIARSIRR